MSVPSGTLAASGGKAREPLHADISRSFVKSMTRYMTWRAMALALTAVSVYAQDQAKTDLGDDFVPGNRVIFVTDFNRDPLGGFPRKFDLKSGNIAVADVKGKRVLRIDSFRRVRYRSSGGSSAAIHNGIRALRLR